ncbi:MAG: hypothetical protein Q9219_002272 [cf. Caloplaca sp. 3 TL-2023]
MSAQNSKGIQTLLDAEREAQKIVQKDRSKRVKDARAEAQKEIEDYRKQKEDEYQKFEKEVKPSPPILFPFPSFSSSSSSSPPFFLFYFAQVSEQNGLTTADDGWGVKQHTSGNKKAEEDASRDAEEQVKAIKASGEKSGGKVIEDLLRVVTDVRPEVPERVGAPAG